MTQRNALNTRGHRRALWLPIPVLLGLAACGGADEEHASAPVSGYKPTACEDGQQQTTPEATYECVDGSWVRAAPRTTPEALKSAPTPPTVPPTVPAATTVPPSAPAVYTVTNVTDGDTVDISSSDGQVFTVRVLGIDAPEIGAGCAADLATETMTNLALGREVALTMGADGEDVDQYGRFLRFVEVDGTDVGLALLSYGLASARHDSSDGDGNHGREAQYLSADDSSIDYSCAPPPPAPSASSAAVYYANCDDVRAHGAAPIHPGDPGWREAFDRDSDGVGCEVATATNPSNPSSPSPAMPVTYTVSGVVDGDTVDIAASDGTAFRVRIIGIDAPEIDTCAGEPALDAMSAMVMGRQVALVMGGDGEDTDGHGRYLRYVDVDGIDAGLSLIEEGNAIARYDGRDGYGRHDREDVYVSADAASLDWTCIDDSELLHHEAA